MKGCRVFSVFLVFLRGMPFEFLKSQAIDIAPLFRIIGTRTDELGWKYLMSSSIAVFLPDSVSTLP